MRRHHHPRRRRNRWMRVRLQKHESKRMRLTCKSVVATRALLKGVPKMKQRVLDLRKVVRHAIIRQTSADFLRWWRARQTKMRRLPTMRLRHAKFLGAGFTGKEMPGLIRTMLQAERLLTSNAAQNSTAP